MKIALLFNSDHPQYNYAYGDKIRDNIFKSNILQSSGCKLRISIGDVIIPDEGDVELYTKICNAIYFSGGYSILLEEKLKSTYYKNVVYAWVIENITKGVVCQLHYYLLKDDAYLGVHDLDYSYLGHLAFYKLSMIPKYRIVNRSCYIRYSMGNEDSICKNETQELKEIGFENVFWEDTGAQGSIFDNYCTEDFFQEVKSVEKILTSYLEGKDEAVEDILIQIEETNPQLFYPLAAAARAMSYAKSEEDFAHVGLSIRRYFECLADTIFPAQEELYKGKKVDRSSYKNRILAFISDVCDDREVNMQRKKLEELIKEANSAVHGSYDKVRITKCLVNMSQFISYLFKLIIPNGKIDKYYPYNKNMMDFINRI